MVDIDTPRRAIKGGQWVVTIQLEVDGTPAGDPLVLRYVDTAVCGAKPGAGKTDKTKRGSLGMPADFGYLLSCALYERAEQLSRRKGKKR